MVEFEDYWVRLAAIDAWMCRKIIENPSSQALLSFGCPSAGGHPISRSGPVVGPAVGVPAFFAIGTLPNSDGSGSVITLHEIV